MKLVALEMRSNLFYALVVPLFTVDMPTVRMPEYDVKVGEIV